MTAEPSAKRTSASTARSDLAGVVLAAGLGTRLRPLTDLRPKALCPVNGVPLVDLALRRVSAQVLGEPAPSGAALTANVAVNAHHHADQVVQHLAGRAHVSVEQPIALGTAGALGRLRPWIDGRPALVVNADTWADASDRSPISGPSPSARSATRLCSTWP